MTSAFPSLAAPALEDTMEVSSSPAGNVFDNDIDIDIDYEYSGTAHLTDDERMLEDGDPTRPPTATDEMMDDGDQDTTVVEEVMQDDPPNDQSVQPDLADEELIDYDDEDYQTVDQSFYDDTTLQNTEANFAAPAEAVAEPEKINEEVTREPELFAEEQATFEKQAAISLVEGSGAVVEAPVYEEPVSEDQNATNAENEDAAPASQEQQSKAVEDGTTVAGETTAEVGEDLLEETDVAANEQEPEGDAEASLKPLPQFAGSLDTSARDVPDGPPTPTDTGLHPLTINYHSHSMPMFKSSRQPDGLLKNDNLASIGLSNLMQDCKDRLKLKLGEEIPEHYELVLSFDRLGLMLVEGNASSYNTSLNDIIDLWKQLHYNDGLADEDVPALSVTLTSQPKFTAAVGMLQKAVNDGQGISSFAPSYAADHETYEDDDQAAHVTDGHTAQEGLELAADEEEHYAEHAEYAQDETDENNSFQEYEGNEYPVEANEDDQAEQYPETGYQGEFDFADFDQHEEYPDPEDFDQDEEHGAQAEATAETFDGPEDAEKPAPEGHIESEEHKTAEVVKPDSAASSTTVRGDTANNPTETDADRDNDDLSALLNDYDDAAGEDEAKDALASGEEAKKQSNTVSAESEDPALPPSEDHQDAANGLESENFFNADITAQPEGDESAAEHGDEQAHENPDESLIEYDDEPLDEADYVDYNNQDDENHTAEEDEQFHTALDLLEGDETDQGPETADAAEPAGQSNQQAYPEDDIGFDDDEAEPETTNKGSTSSPHGKRSFEEHADEDELNFDEEPELKKARSD